MLRVAAVRTGVEVLGSETTWLVPIDPPYDEGLPPEFLRLEGSPLHVHPAMWIHEILDPAGPLLGYLVMSPGDERSVELFEATASAIGDVEPAGVDGAYKRFRPGEEHWIWLGAPWPDAFVLRAVEYTAELDANVLEQPRFAYPIDQFRLQGGPVALAERRYRIRTDPGGPPVGFLSLDGEDQQIWAADPNALYQRLIPPHADGTWRFDQTTAEAPPSFVPLSQGLLPRIDLSSRG